jgi:hypothetical protein
MILPRRLYRTADGAFCEEDDLRQAFAFGSPGMNIPDAEAERIGLTAYLDAYEKAHSQPAAEAKMVPQAEVEDKAVGAPQEAKAEEPPAAEEDKKDEPGPGLHIQSESRRIGGGRRA